MRYLSVCSGIEAATVAWEPLGWTPLAFSEIEAFPSAVLTHHYPNTPNMGDMERFDEWRLADDPDVLVGGTPCQSFSVAGLRRGMDDPRGNLTLVYLGLVERYRPRWVVWENVPGVLSSDGGRAFGAFLGGLEKLGYGWAYRMLDAQYFGLAQRRRRVFVVASPRGWAAAGSVLFEPESLRGDFAPRREAGERTAPSLAARTRGGGGLGTDTECDGGLIPQTTHSLDSYSAGRATEDGTGRGTPLVPEWPATVAPTLDAHYGDKMGLEDQHALNGAGLFVPEALPFDTTQVTSKTNRSNPQPGDPCHPLTHCGHAPTIAFHNRQDPDVSGEVTHPLGAKDNGQAVAYDEYNVSASYVHHTLPADGCRHPTGGAVAHGLSVRRLTPRECERLQGFPDDYTLIPYRNRWSKDGPRYKALGNSMAVPVMAWIGRRIAMADEVCEAMA
jgi:DNA (cytosine-5)-methyltransferase 1